MSLTSPVRYRRGDGAIVFLAWVFIIALYILFVLPIERAKKIESDNSQNCKIGTVASVQQDEGFNFVISLSTKSGPQVANCTNCSDGTAVVGTKMQFSCYRRTHFFEPTGPEECWHVPNEHQISSCEP